MLSSPTEESFLSLLCPELSPEPPERGCDESLLPPSSSDLGPPLCLSLSGG